MLYISVGISPGKICTNLAWRQRILSLNELRPGETGIIRRILANVGLKKRLLQMEFVPGEKVSVIDCAPLGDPIRFIVKGYRLSLRKGEAQNIIIDLS